MTSLPSAESSARKSKRGVVFKAVAVLAVVFGLATVRAGAQVLFGDGAAREAAGNYVGFVVWFNFLAGFLYVMAGIGLWSRRPWAARLAMAIALSTLLVFAAFALHVAGGGAWEGRTAAAMTLRSVVWVAITALAWPTIRHDRRRLHPRT